MKKIKKIITIIFLLVVVTSISSCAIMFNGTKENVTIKSMTQNSKIYVNGELTGTDVVNVKLPRKNNHTIMVKKNGCNTETVTIKPHIQWGWVAFDAVLNWFAFLTDAPTGAWNSFDQTKVTVELKCNN